MDTIQNSTFMVILSNEDQEKIGDFQTEFKKPINLNHQFECAITEIDLPSGIKQSIVKDTFKIKLKLNFESLKEFVDVNSKYYEDVIKDENYRFKQEYSLQFKDVNELSSNLTKINKIAKEYTRDKIKSFFPRLDFADFKAKTKLVYPELSIKDQKLEIRRGYLLMSNMTGYIDGFAVTIKSWAGNVKESESDSTNLWLIEKEFEEQYILRKFERSDELQSMFDLIIDPEFSYLLEDSKNVIAYPKIGQTISHSIVSKFESELVLVYVYSNIIKESIVGNVKANILRVFQYDRTKSSVPTQYKFTNLFFIPLRIEEINSIRIQLRDNLGRVIKYEEGYISLTLLFRPIEHM